MGRWRQKICMDGYWTVVSRVSISLTTPGLNLLGDAFPDVLTDPRLRGCGFR
jgi:hypothetical protein